MKQSYNPNIPLFQFTSKFCSPKLFPSKSTDLLTFPLYLSVPTSLLQYCFYQFYPQEYQLLLLYRAFQITIEISLVIVHLTEYINIDANIVHESDSNDWEEKL